MPEGPEIRRAADNLEAAIKGKPLTDVWFAFPQLKTYCPLYKTAISDCISILSH